MRPPNLRSIMGGQHLLRQQERRGQVDGKGGVPCREIDVLPTLYVGCARVGDEHVDLAEFVVACATSSAGAFGSDMSAATTVTRLPN